jgi:hypothetical protein
VRVVDREPGQVLELEPGALRQTGARLTAFSGHVGALFPPHAPPEVACQVRALAGVPALTGQDTTWNLTDARASPLHRVVAGADIVVDLLAGEPRSVEGADRASPASMTCDSGDATDGPRRARSMLVEFTGGVTPVEQARLGASPARCA